MLPAFADRSFDWVFSNAVIEHVGGIEEQRKFASEISRVARCGYFVTTPNKFFPIEPHTLLPLYQFLPERWQRKVVRISPYYMHVYERVRLLGLAICEGCFQGQESFRRDSLLWEQAS